MCGASQVAAVVKNLPATVGDVREEGSTPGSRRSPGGGHGNPLQYSCLANPMDRGACWARQSPWGHKESDVTEVADHTQHRDQKVDSAWFASSTFSIMILINDCYCYYFSKIFVRPKSKTDFICINSSDLLSFSEFPSMLFLPL